MSLQPARSSSFPSAFDKLPSATLRERISEILRNAILNGSLKEGSRLVERHLAEQFQTSLTAVREALIRLEAEGFVTKRPNAATHVTKLSLEVTEKIFAVRRVLETYAVEQAAREGTPQQIEELQKAFLAMTDAARKGPAADFIVKDYALHQLIWTMSGNEYLCAALKRISPPVFAFAAIRFATHGHPFDLMRDSVSHSDLVKAIAAKDPEAARNAFLSALDEWLTSTRDHVYETVPNAKVVAI